MAGGRPTSRERRLADALARRRSKAREMPKVWESQGEIVIRPGAGCFLPRNGSSGQGVLDVLGLMVHRGRQATRKTAGHGEKRPSTAGLELGEACIVPASMGILLPLRPA